MSDRDRKEVMSSMSDNFETQEDPKVGIFWLVDTHWEIGHGWSEEFI
jgi:hypothetical protein